LRIGFDLDNTIVDYTESSKLYAQLNSIHGVSDTSELRNFFLSHNDFSGWTRAQSWLYFDGLEYAQLSDGIIETIEKLRNLGSFVAIVSHKTERTPDDFGSFPIRQQMQDWLTCTVLPTIVDDNIFYSESLEDKITLIEKMSFDYFVDDLVKVLKHPRFPLKTKPILYSTQSKKSTETIRVIHNIVDVLNVI
jgi:hypothetical protein